MKLGERRGDASRGSDLNSSQTQVGVMIVRLLFTLLCVCAAFSLPNLERSTPDGERKMTLSSAMERGSRGDAVSSATLPFVLRLAAQPFVRIARLGEQYTGISLLDDAEEEELDEENGAGLDDALQMVKMISNLWHYGSTVAPLPLRQAESMSEEGRDRSSESASVPLDADRRAAPLLDARKRAVAETTTKPVLTRQEKVDAIRKFTALPQFIGCYGDRQTLPEFSVRHLMSDYELLGPVECRRLCAETEPRAPDGGAWRYFAIRARFCYCTNDFGIYGRDYAVACDIACPATMHIGGSDADSTPGYGYMIASCGGMVAPPKNDSKDADETGRRRKRQEEDGHAAAADGGEEEGSAAARYAHQWRSASDFEQHHYDERRNSVYRVAPTNACGLGRQITARRTKDVCLARRRCFVEEMWCGRRQLQQFVAPFNFRWELGECLVTKLRCEVAPIGSAAGTPGRRRYETVDLHAEFDAEGCQVMEAECGTHKDPERRVPADLESAHLSVCAVSVACNGGRFFGYHGFDWTCTNETLSCRETDGVCTVETYVCDLTRDAYPAVTSGRAPTDADIDERVRAATCATVTDVATRTVAVDYCYSSSSEQPCLASTTELSCVCPSDRRGARCEQKRGLMCRLELVAPPAECRQSTVPNDVLLSADRSCVNVMQDEELTLATRLDCQFAPDGSERGESPLGNVTDALAVVRALVERYSEAWLNQTLDLPDWPDWFTGGDAQRALIDDSFVYARRRDGHFALSDPEVWTLRRKTYNMVYLSDNSEVYFKRLSHDEALGDALLNVTETFGALPELFRAGGRVYLEIQWSTDERPMGASERGMLLRQYVDIIDADVSGVIEGDTEVVLSSSATMAIVVISIALALLAIAFAYAALVWWRRRRRRAAAYRHRRLINEDE